MSYVAVSVFRVAGSSLRATSTYTRSVDVVVINLVRFLIRKACFIRFPDLRCPPTPSR